MPVDRDFALLERSSPFTHLSSVDFPLRRPAYDTTSPFFTSVEHREDLEAAVPLLTF